MAARITGQIFIGAGCFIGRFDQPSPTVLGYRDHSGAPPWSLQDIASMVDRTLG